VAHLETLRTPALIVQGSRDAFGSREEVQGYVLAPSIRVLFLEAGDHSFKPPRGAAESEARLLERAVAAVDEFLSGLR
jgi:predicted alpha/beta-hydrolase family hydrolase